MKERKLWKVQEHAFVQQDLIFKLTHSFPRDELYGVTSQIRRSSRSVGANLAETYRKSDYPQHLILKLTDADAENSETAYWLSVCIGCEYCSPSQIANILDINSQIGRLLHYMKHNPTKFTYK